MAITNGYTTLDVLRFRWLDSHTYDATTYDAMMESIIETASRAIDWYCGRVFFITAATARIYTAQAPSLLLVDDLVSVDADGLTTDSDGDRTYENTWATTDFLLLPANAATDGEPYTMIRIDPYGSYSFPVGVVNGVKITGTWGYCATIPKPIAETCILFSEQIMSRKDAVFGAIGAPGGGAIMQMATDILCKDPHFQAMLAGYRRFS